MDKISVTESTIACSDERLAVSIITSGNFSGNLQFWRKKKKLTIFYGHLSLLTTGRAFAFILYAHPQFSCPFLSPTRKKKSQVIIIPSYMCVMDNLVLLQLSWRALQVFHYMLWQSVQNRE